MSKLTELERRYDPELPFLRELELEVERFAQRTLRRPMSEMQSLGERRRSSLRGPRAGVRVARRSLTLVALLCLIGASAYGARQALSGGGAPSPLDTHNGQQLVVAHGARGSRGWSLGLYERGGELCRVLSFDEGESSRCSAPPGARSIGVSGAVDSQRRYVFGVAGQSVLGVMVQIGSLRTVVPTQPLNARAARAVGLPPQIRYYAIALARRSGSERPARVSALDAHGRPLGSALLACPETSESADGASC